MTRVHILAITLVVFGSITIGDLWADAEPTADLNGFQRDISPLLRSHCADCHGPDLQEGNLDLSGLDPNLLAGDHLEHWRMVRERLRANEMPPKGSPTLNRAERDRLLAWLDAEFLKTQQPGVLVDRKLLLPRFGNYVDHEALFDSDTGPVIPGPPRLWRMRPEIYDRFANQVIRRSPKGLSSPFSVLSEADFTDYAALYFVDEPTTEMLLTNAAEIVDQQLAHHGELRELVDPDKPPTPEQVRRGIGFQLRIAHNRPATADELDRFVTLWEQIEKDGGHVVAGRTVLAGILMRPGVLFRRELGAGPIDELGRQRLAPREITYAVSFALGNHPDGKLLDAASKGELADRQAVVEHVRRMLDEETNPRLMQFFREYFGYPYAKEVFKDNPERGDHDPERLVSDLELMIADILKKDTDVLYELLTTNRYYINAGYHPKTGEFQPGDPRKTEYATVYGLPPDWKWRPDQPIELPADERAGVLTHPAWLVAWSGNFDNHPVQRGKWVRTHLLGGGLPDLPIGVDARVPEDEHRTFRERLASATGKRECWRCHRKMDPLGLPFEQYDHYGHYRRQEVGKPVMTTGEVRYTDVPELDGPVDSPVELVRKLARSERAEQVFVRHAFRFFLGRNETLGDAQTLQDAHRAYRDNGGSFRALVVSLLGSDSFLYRRPRGEPKP